MINNIKEKYYSGVLGVAVEKAKDYPLTVKYFNKISLKNVGGIYRFEADLFAFLNQFDNMDFEIGKCTTLLKTSLYNLNIVHCTLGRNFNFPEYFVHIVFFRNKKLLAELSIIPKCGTKAGLIYEITKMCFKKIERAINDR